jgi:hypothetical protein
MEGQEIGFPLLCPPLRSPVRREEGDRAVVLGEDIDGWERSSLGFSSLL